MAHQLVKKHPRDKRKRKGYKGKGSGWKSTAKGVGAGALTWGGWDLLNSILNSYPLVKTGDVLLKEELEKLNVDSEESWGKINENFKKTNVQYGWPY